MRLSRYIQVFLAKFPGLYREYLLMLDGHVTERWIAAAVLQPGSVVLDVGAFNGTTTLLYSDLCGLSGKVYAFEPVPTTYGRLRENINLNAWYKNVEMLCYAFSNEKGDGVIEIPGEAYIEASLHDHHTGSWAETEERTGFDCRLVQMEEFVEARQLSALEYIRCDTVGSELLVIQGAGESLRKFRPVINFEYVPEMATDFGHDAEELFETLFNSEYDGYFISPKTIFTHPDPSELKKAVAGRKCNVTAFQTEKHERLLHLLEEQIPED